MAKPVMNTNGEFSVGLVNSTLQERMDAFDRLPKWARDLANYASYRLAPTVLITHVNKLNREMFEKRLKEITRENAKVCYGPDHPQAKEIQ